MHQVSARRSEDLRHALEDFQAALDGGWSYRHANRAEFGAAVAALRKKVDAGISPNDFGIDLQKIIALGIDGHAGVSGYDLPRGGYLPFLVEPRGDRFVAFKPDRTGFLAEGFPYLTKIDGKDVADWCEAAAVLVPKGSPQYVRRQCLRHLRELDYLRGLMRLPKRETVEIELAAKDGRVRRTVSLATATRSPRYGVRPRCPAFWNATKRFVVFPVICIPGTVWPMSGPSVLVKKRSSKGFIKNRTATVTNKGPSRKLRYERTHESHPCRFRL